MRSPLVTIDTPATKKHLMQILMAGAPPVSVARLLPKKFEQLEQGVSYVLLRGGQPLGAAGFVRIEEPSPASLAIAGARPVFVLWFLTSQDAGPHAGRIARRARIEMRALADAGACVLADIDANFSAAKKLASACGLLPRSEVEGHSLWEFTDAPLPRGKNHGRNIGTFRNAEQERAAAEGGARPPDGAAGAGGTQDAAE